MLRRQVFWDRFLTVSREVTISKDFWNDQRRGLLAKLIPSLIANIVSRPSREQSFGAVQISAMVVVEIFEFRSETSFDVSVT